MLAELAAANAAFAVIKTAVQNGKDIAAAGSAIASFVGAKEDLQRKAQQEGWWLRPRRVYGSRTDTRARRTTQADHDLRWTPRTVG